MRMIDDRSKHEWIIEWFMFADVTVLLGDDEQKLQRLVNELGRLCRRRSRAVYIQK